MKDTTDDEVEMNKTEILITEPLDGLPKQFIKDNIKLFGYYYGNNANNRSFEEKLKKNN